MAVSAAEQETGRKMLIQSGSKWEDVGNGDSLSSLSDIEGKDG